MKQQLSFSCKLRKSNSSVERLNFDPHFQLIKTLGISAVIWCGPLLTDRTGLMIMCQYSKSLLSPLIHWPFPWKHSSPVTLTDEQGDPLTSNLFMLMSWHSSWSPGLHTAAWYHQWAFPSQKRFPSPPHVTVLLSSPSSTDCHVFPHLLLFKILGLPSTPTDISRSLI